MSLSFKGAHTCTKKKSFAVCAGSTQTCEILQSMIYKQTNIKADFTYSMDTILLREKDSYKCLKRFYRFFKGSPIPALTILIHFTNVQHIIYNT